MPYSDETGRIMIDEVAASSDVMTLTAGQDKMKEALNQVQHLMSINSDFSGGIKDSLDETLIQLSKAIEEQIQLIENAKQAINKTVEHYQQIDQNLKNTVHTTLP